MNKTVPTQKLITKINKAKLELVMTKNTTFFSSLLANLKLVWTEDIPTAATDGICIWLNPEFVEQQNQSELIGLLLHEVMHVAYEHMDRRKAANLDPMLWNVAGDYVINNFLDSKNILLPQEALIDHKYDNMNTKQVYDDLLKNNLSTPQIWLDLIDPGSKESSQESPGTSTKERQETVITNVLKATTQAKLSNDIGSIPGEIARQLEDLLNPKLPWQSILQNNLNSYTNTDYSWKRPNKRFWPNHYLPHMHQESLNQITAGIDVSGSISDQQLSEFISEIKYIKTVLQPKSFRLICFDTRIVFDKTYEEGDDIENTSVKGGGGTLLGPLMDTLSKDQPELAIILTDGEFSMPHMDDIQTDIFWIIHSAQVEAFNPPKGTVIGYEDA